MIPRGTLVIFFFSGIFLPFTWFAVFLLALDPVLRFFADDILLRRAPDAEVADRLRTVFLVAPQMQPDLLRIFRQFLRTDEFGKIDARLDSIHAITLIDGKAAPDFPVAFFLGHEVNAPAPGNEIHFHAADAASHIEADIAFAGRAVAVDHDPGAAENMLL